MSSKTLCAWLTAITAAAVVAGCSSGTQNSDTGAGGTEVSDAASTPQLAQAQSAAEAASKNPAGLTITTPLSRKPPTGKLIVSIQNAQPTSAVENQAATQAAKALGWTLKIITQGSGAQDPINAFEAAIGMHPAAIHYSGTPVALIKNQLAQAQSDGIVVVPDAITDPLTAPMITNTITGGSMVASQGKQVADYIAWKSGGKANIQMFTMPVYPILVSFDNGFTSELSRVCPQCKYQKNPQQESDIGTRTPQSVVSALQKNPDATWAVFSIGGLETGVLPALKAAGLASQVDIAGVTPDQGILQEMRSGQNEVWSGFSTPIQGWTYIDALARYFVGDPQAGKDIPNQLITPANVRGIVTDQSGYYVGYGNYANAFMKLWSVS